MLQLDAMGLLRIPRRSVYAQALLLLSQDRENPTKAAALTSRLSDRFSSPAIYNCLRELCQKGFAEKVGYGLYVRTWGQLPEAVNP